MERRRTSTRVLIAVLTALMGLVLLSAPASAAPNPNVRYTVYVTNAAIHEMRASYSWHCMDIRDKSTKPGAIVQRTECNGQLNQRFYFVDHGNGTFSIHAYWQGYCIGAVAPAQHAPITLNDCNNYGSSFRWVDQGNNHWEIVEANTGMCMRENGRRGQLTLATCTRPLAVPYPTLWTAVYKGQYNYGNV